MVTQTGEAKRALSRTRADLVGLLGCVHAGSERLARYPPRRRKDEHQARWTALI